MIYPVALFFFFLVSFVHRNYYLGCIGKSHQAQSQRCFANSCDDHETDYSLWKWKEMYMCFDTVSRIGESERVFEKL